VRRAGLSRNTIRATLRPDTPPTFRCPERPAKLEPFKDEIHRLLEFVAAVADNSLAIDREEDAYLAELGRGRGARR